MVQAHVWVSARCDQCATTPGGPDYESEAALGAAMVDGWVAAPDGRLLCSACGPILICEAEGHEFTAWHPARPVPGELPRTCCCRPRGVVHLLGSADCGREFRYCRRCCLHESRTVSMAVAS